MPQQQNTGFITNNYIQPKQPRQLFDLTQFNRLVDMNNQYDDKTRELSTNIMNTLRENNKNLNEKESSFLLNKAKEYEKLILNGINTMSPAKAYDNAIEVAKLANLDKDLKLRNDAGTEYNKVITDVEKKYDSKQIDKDTLDYYKDTHPYSFNEETGLLSSFKDDKDKTVYDTIDWTKDIFTPAFSLVSERSKQSSTGSQSNLDKDGNELNITTSWSKGSSIQYKNKKDILENIRYSLRQPEMLARVRQEINVNSWKLQNLEKEISSIDKNSGRYKQMQDEIKSLRSVLYVNGWQKTADEILTDDNSLNQYIQYKIKDADELIENMAYTRTASSREDGRMFNDTNHGGRTDPNSDPNYTPNNGNDDGETTNITVETYPGAGRQPKDSMIKQSVNGVFNKQTDE